jgi:polysaccharide pyruvyl transferase WcaK-like protein
MKINKKATIFGFHGMKNLGDDYFLKLLIKIFERNNYKEIYISGITENLEKSSKIKVTGIFSKTMKLRWIERWLRVFIFSLKSEILLFSAGSILTILEFKFAYYLIRILKILKPRIKILALGVSIGPFKNENDRKNALKLLSLFNEILVRDEKSLEYIPADFNVKVSLSQDLAYTFLNEKIEQNSISNKKNLGIALNDYHLLFGKQFLKTEQIRNDKVINLIKKLILGKKIDKITIFVTSSHEIYGDQRVSEYIYSKLNKEIETIQIIYDNNFDDFIKELSKCDLIISSRLHTGFFGLAQGIKLIQLSYAEKIDNFYKNNNINGLKIYNAYEFNEEKIFDDIKFLLTNDIENNSILKLKEKTVLINNDLKKFERRWL